MKRTHSAVGRLGNDPESEASEAPPPVEDPQPESRQDGKEHQKVLPRVLEPIEKPRYAAEDDPQDREQKSDCDNTVRHDFGKFGSDEARKRRRIRRGPALVRDALSDQSAGIPFPYAILRVMPGSAAPSESVMACLSSSEKPMVWPSSSV